MIAADLARPASQQIPLDEAGRRSGATVFRQSTSSGRAFARAERPLETERGPAGVLQVGINLELLDVTRAPWPIAGAGDVPGHGASLGWPPGS